MTNSLLDRDTRAIAAIGKLRCYPLTARHAEGCWIVEEDGRRVLDLSGAAGAVQLGYGHPAVVDAVNRGLREQAGASDLFAAARAPVELAERLLEITPGGEERRVWFGHSGSDANDTVMRVVSAATGRRRFVAFAGAYHGGIAGSMSVSNHPSQQHTLPRPGLIQIPYANAYRPVMPEPVGESILGYLDFVLETQCPPEDIAAVFIEPIQSDGGMIVPPKGFLKGLEERCRRYGILVVSDEVKVGMGRPGAWHAFEAEGLTPDIVVFGKGIGGTLPLSAIVAPAEIMDFQSAFALITTTGNAVSTTVGKAVIDTIEREGLLENARARGAQLMDGLRDIATRQPLIGEVRGRGLAIGFELVRDRETKEPADTETAKFCYRAYELGAALVYVGVHGNVPELTPPLTLSADEAAQALDIIERALDDVARGRVSDEDVAAYAGW